MAFTRTWDAAYMQLPADTDAASEGANRIRDFKTDIKERMAIDHSMAGDADDGKHLQLTFKDPLGAKPSASASEGYLYTKDVSAKAELFWEDEDGNEVQFTEGGNLFAFPATTKMVFAQAAAPTGWTQDATDDRALRVVSSSGGGTGGTNSIASTHLHTTGDHTLATNEIPSHRHTESYQNISGTGYPGYSGSGNAATTGNTGYAGGGAAHNHGNTGNAAAFKYADVIFATKD